MKPRDFGSEYGIKEAEIFVARNLPAADMRGGVAFSGRRGGRMVKEDKDRTQLVIDRLSGLRGAQL